MQCAMHCVKKKKKSELVWGSSMECAMHCVKAKGQFTFKTVIFNFGIKRLKISMFDWTGSVFIFYCSL